MTKISASEVSACLVTRGDVDMTPIIESLPFDDIVIWDNSQRQDAVCYGRFLAINEARHPYIYLQDDDVIVPVDRILAEYDPDSDDVFANKPDGEGWRFLGLGALFHRRLVGDTFTRFLDRHPYDREFCRTADVVFAYQHDYRSMDFGYENLPQQTWMNRMYRDPDHMEVRVRAHERVAAL